MNTDTRKVYKKYVGYFLGLVILLTPVISLADFILGQCARIGFTIATINGISTEDRGAQDNMKALKNKLGISWDNQEIDYQYFLNPSHLGGVGDIGKSILQGLFDSETVKDYDLIEMLRDASEKVATQKLLLVAHSQGNFYANSFYDTVAGQDGGAPAESIGVYSVATPSGRVAGEGKWLTSDTDKVIAGVVGRIPFRKIMEPNTHIELQSGDDFWGHNFSGIYLNYQGDKIISDIKSSLDQLKTNDIQDAQKPCLAPPELSLTHGIQGKAFAATDKAFLAVFKLPEVIGQYVERVAVGAVSAGINAIKVGVGKVVEIAQTIKETFSEVFRKNEFQLAQITDLPQEARANQSEEAFQQLNSRQCSFDTSQLPSRSKVIINEIAWMGGFNSANDEWIELKNISNNSLDVSGYQLIDRDEKIKIVFEKGSVIPANGFYLLERTDDAAVLEAKADVVYNGILSNSNDGIRLFNGECDLVDEALASPDWPAGDNAAKKTMERNLSGFSWHTSSGVGGTPKKENSQAVLAKIQEAAATISEETEENGEIFPRTDGQLEQQKLIQQATIGLQQTANFGQCGFSANQSPSRSKAIINEVAWMGGANSANEWIELKNISGAEVDIGGWQLVDKDEQIKIIFPSGSKITGDGFYLSERNEDAVSNIKADVLYSGNLRNSDEGLRLFDNNCGLIDEVLANPGWPAGDNIQKRTMERSSDLSWHNYNGLAQNNILGTPKAENSAPTVISSGGGSGGGNRGSGSSVSVPTDSPATTPVKILISEIKITGGPGKTENDFIELYNFNNYQINLNGYRLVKRTKTGTTDTSIKSWTTDIYVPANGYYLWANSGYADISATPDAITTATISDDNGVAIRFGAADTGAIIDSAGWGGAQNAFVEGSVFLTNPGANQSIQRKFQNNTFIDNGDNANDFEIQSCPSPKAQTCQQANQAPKAFFVYAPLNPIVGETIIFNAASSTDDGQIISYQWNFGDNSTSTISIATTTHIYSQAGDYQVDLIVFDNQNTSSTAISTAISINVSGADHVVISEIQAGTAGNTDNEFIELYNPTKQTIGLNDWSLKRKISQTATSTKNLVLNFSATSTIASKGFFLIAHNDYDGLVAPDLRYSNNSNPLAYDDDVVILQDNIGSTIDEVAYNEILVGKSLERKSNATSTVDSMINYDDRFLGNSYDADNPGDFILRNISNPQNSRNFPEPRDAPNSPENFIIQYSSGAMKLIFSWDASSDYGGATSTLTYRITDISDSSSTLAAIDAALTGAEIAINERGRSYVFSIQAFDKEGLGSLKSDSQIDIPPIKQTILTQQLDDTAETGSDSAIVQKLSLTPGEFQGSFNRIELRVFSDDGYNYMHSVWVKEINPDNALDYNLLFYTNYADFGPPNQWNAMVYDVGNITTKSDKIYEFAIRGRYGGFGGPGSQSNLKVKGSSNPDSYPYGNADGMADLYFKIYLEE